MSLEDIILSIGGSIIAILLGGNMYFISGLVDEIKMHSKSIISSENSIDALNNAITSFVDEVKEIKEEIKHLRRMEVDIAILKQKLDDN